MSPQTPAENTELVSRLRVIEQQPLGARAAAYASVHDELSRRLESVTPSPDEASR